MTIERESHTRPTSVVDAGTRGFDPETMLPENGSRRHGEPEDPFLSLAPEEPAPTPAQPQPAPEAVPAHPVPAEPDYTGYLALDIVAQDPQTLAEIIRDNMGKDGLSANDLKKVTVPAGGTRHWMVPGPQGDEPAQAIEGIIIHKTDPRAYYARSIEESAGNRAPDCFSPDGEYGRPGPEGAARVPLSDGTTGVACATCPLNVWGTGPNGRGKACKENELLFLLQPDSVLPLVLQAPPTSLQPIRDYMFSLVDNRDYRPYWQVVTKLELETVRGDMPYSRIMLSRSQSLPRQFAAQLRQYRENIIPVLTRYNNTVQQLLAEPAPPETPALPEGRPEAEGPPMAADPAALEPPPPPLNPAPQPPAPAEPRTAPPAQPQPAAAAVPPEGPQQQAFEQPGPPQA